MRILGAIMLLTLFAGIFAVVSTIVGWKVATWIFLMALVLTGWVVVAVCLLV